jgi:hypothetical protein
MPREHPEPEPEGLLTWARRKVAGGQLLIFISRSRARAGAQVPQAVRPKTGSKSKVAGRQLARPYMALALSFARICIALACRFSPTIVTAREPQCIRRMSDKTRPDGATRSPSWRPRSRGVSGSAIGVWPYRRAAKGAIALGSAELRIDAELSDWPAA